MIQIMIMMCSRSWTLLWLKSCKSCTSPQERETWETGKISRASKGKKLTATQTQGARPNWSTKFGHLFFWKVSMSLLWILNNWTIERNILRPGTAGSRVGATILLQRPAFSEDLVSLALILAPQRGALRRLVFRDFQSQCIHLYVGLSIQIHSGANNSSKTDVAPRC